VAVGRAKQGAVAGHAAVSVGQLEARGHAFEVNLVGQLLGANDAEASVLARKDGRQPSDL
jgi:hypothetical protein